MDIIEIRMRALEVASRIDGGAFVMKPSYLLNWTAVYVDYVLRGVNPFDSPTFSPNDPKDPMEARPSR